MKPSYLTARLSEQVPPSKWITAHLDDPLFAESRSMLYAWLLMLRWQG